MDDLQNSRRQFLTAATTVIGGVGLGLASVPFVGSWLPSARAVSAGAPVEVDLSKIEEGQRITIAWRGKPVFIINRSPQLLSSVAQSTELLRDPNSTSAKQPSYITGPLRSIHERFLIIIGVCTHLGCVPLYKPKTGSIESSWKGGFFCPCHGSKFDMAGRVYKGVPAPTNLEIPPHKYLTDTTLLIGAD